MRISVKNFKRIIICFIFCLNGFIVLKAQDTLLTLDKAIQMGLANNFGIKISQSVAQIAANNVTRGNAGLEPNLNFTTNLTPSSGYLNQEYSSNTSINKPFYGNVYNSGLQGSYILYNGRINHLEFSKLGELKNLAGLNVRTNIEQVVYDIMRSYYNIIRQQELYNALKEQLNYYEERARLAKSRLDIGSGNRLDVLQTQSDLQIQKTQLLRQQQLIDVGKTQLYQLMILKSVFNYVFNDTLVSNSYNLIELQANAHANNIQNEVLKTQEAVSYIVLQQVEGLRKPTISFNPTFLIGRTDNNAGLTLVNQNATLAANFNLSLPIYDGKNISRQISNAKINLGTFKTQKEQLAYNLDENLHLQYQYFINAKAILNSEEENLVVARQSIEIAMERFRLSRSTILELNTFQQVYENGLSRLVAAKYDAKIAEIELLRLSGALSPK